MIVLRRISGSVNMAIDEVLVGALDGDNQTFTTPHAYKTGQINLIYNGQVLGFHEFEEIDSNTVTLINKTPLADEDLRATYVIDS
jgi:hypothetical protein